MSRASTICHCRSLVPDLLLGLGAGGQVNTHAHDPCQHHLPLQLAFARLLLGLGAAKLHLPIHGFSVLFPLVKVRWHHSLVTVFVTPILCTRERASGMDAFEMCVGPLSRRQTLVAVWRRRRMHQPSSLDVRLALDIGRCVTGYHVSDIT